MILWTLVLAFCLWLGSRPVEGGSHETGIGSTPGSKGTSCPCGTSKKGRVIGGSKALQNEYPWMVSMFNIDTFEYKCGASIITNKVVITAAHCTKAIEPGEPLNIIAGTSDINKLSGAQIIPVARWIEHERYSFGGNLTFPPVNDISLMILARPLIFNSNIVPVCLPLGKINLENEWVKFIGWGRTGPNRPVSDYLMEVDLKVISFSACQKAFPVKTPQTQICTKGSHKGGCKGDSGGPVTWLDPETNRYTLVGLVSYGSNTCDPNVPSVNTEVASFLPWIKSKIGSLGCQKVEKKVLKRKSNAKHILYIQ